MDAFDLSARSLGLGKVLAIRTNTHCLSEKSRLNVMLTRLRSD